MHELSQLHNWIARLRTWSHYNPLKCWKLTPNSMAPISKRNDTYSNNTVKTSNLSLHWKQTKILDSIKYSQASSRVRWLSSEQTAFRGPSLSLLSKNFHEPTNLCGANFFISFHNRYMKKSTKPHDIPWFTFLYKQQGRIRSQCPCLSAILQILLHSMMMEKIPPIHNFLYHLYSLTQPHSHSVKMLALITSTQALCVGWYRPQQLEGEYNRRQKWKYKVQWSPSSMKLHSVVCT